MTITPGRIKTFTPGDIATAAHLNAIQDRAGDNAQDLQDQVAELAARPFTYPAFSAWTLAHTPDEYDGDDANDFDPETELPRIYRATSTQGGVMTCPLVELPCGGNRIWLPLPTVAPGRQLHKVEIHAFAPTDGGLEFTLRQVASHIIGPTPIPNWTATTNTGTYETVTLQAAPLAFDDQLAPVYFIQARNTASHKAKSVCTVSWVAVFMA